MKKFKARFCAQGDQQLKGIDFFETYAPVVQWTMVHLLLVCEILLELKLKQGDVTTAFLHADLDKQEKVYMEVPLGFQKKAKFFTLKRLFMVYTSPQGPFVSFLPMQ